MHVLHLLLVGASFNAIILQAQPWERPLMQAWSADGVTFSVPSIFQDSSGVPSVIRWKPDTLICAFQWFRQPMGSPSWDRVAVKFSYDDGQSWTTPEAILVNGLPSGYQRPFDPTLVKLGGDSLRIYFSSSATPPMGLDASVNTYSAHTTDGVNYTFEPGARVDVATMPVIDPAVIRFGPGWHYAAPAGAPQDGAYHYLSPNGIDFNAVPMIPSDAMHNWTGNYMVESPNELRFYGAGQNGVWYNSSPNGGTWNGYVSTNIMGGDPSVVKVADNSYLIVYVGQPYAMGVDGPAAASAEVSVVPVPARDRLRIVNGSSVVSYLILSMAGASLQEGRPMNGMIDVQRIPAGAHLLQLHDAEGERTTLRIMKE